MTEVDNGIYFSLNIVCVCLCLSLSVHAGFCLSLSVHVCVCLSVCFCLFRLSLTCNFSLSDLCLVTIISILYLYHLCFSLSFLSNICVISTSPVSFCSFECIKLESEREDFFLIGTISMFFILSLVFSSLAARLTQGIIG